MFCKPPFENPNGGTRPNLYLKYLAIVFHCSYVPQDLDAASVISVYLVKQIIPFADLPAAMGYDTVDGINPKQPPGMYSKPYK